MFRINSKIWCNEIKNLLNFLCDISKEIYEGATIETSGGQVFLSSNGYKKMQKSFCQILLSIFVRKMS